MSVQKVLDSNSIAQTVDKINDQGKTIVFTNGCFDILHPGHIAYLEKARQLGDVLIIGINSDQSIQRIKGETRPINNFHFRSTMVAALESVSFVIEFDQDTPLELIKQIKPSILVKGDDYEIDDIVGGGFIKSIGGKVQTISFLEGYSTSSIISKIQRLT
jgi:rfaE bifunctional protein nucleotidyltransferase chain/domain